MNLPLDTDKLPNRPQRANGIARYKVLVEATEQLLNEEGPGGVTIKAIAEQSGIPMASVYHFFPSPAAACVALAEKHLDQLLNLALKSSTKKVSNEDSHQGIMRTTVSYYNRHPAARHLILGSEYNSQIRHADLAANTKIALIIAETLPPLPEGRVELDIHLITKTAIRISDAIWSLSVVETGKITKAYAREAERAVDAYLTAIFTDPSHT